MDFSHETLQQHFGKKNKRTLKQDTLTPLPVVTFVPRGNPRNKSF